MKYRLVLENPNAKFRNQSKYLGITFDEDKLNEHIDFIRRTLKELHSNSLEYFSLNLPLGIVFIPGELAKNCIIRIESA